jgi:uncharacterized membrane protein
MWIDRRWLVPAIALSALLNVFLIGVIAGHVYAGRGAPDRGAVVPSSRVRALPPDQRKAFWAAMAPERAAVAAARAAQLAARRALETEIAAPVFDRARVGAAFAALRDAGVVVQAHANAALVDALATLPPAARASLVTRPATATDAR